MSVYVEGLTRTPTSAQKLQFWWSLTLLVASTTYLLLYLPAIDQKPWSWTRTISPTPATQRTGTGLAVVDAIYVVSLLSRQDRREDMDTLARRLNLHWTYVDAVSANDSVAKATLEWVKQSRAKSMAGDLNPEPQSSKGVTFSWPPDIDVLAHSDEPLDTWNPTDLLDLDSGDDAFEGDYPEVAIPVATQDYEISTNITGLPDWMILTPGRVACWHSHLNVIKQIANSRNLEAALVLEDDVDMEQDIDSQLTYLWNFLPSDWDVVFLGHCWSDESHYPALSVDSPRHNHSHALEAEFSSSEDGPASSHRIHPSFAPKCTHAYILSHVGARKLFLHLRYPPFAFSRAIDQAMAWLVQSGRLRSFSVVPSLVVQRKISRSDIKSVSGHGAKYQTEGDKDATRPARIGEWKEELTKGTLGGLGAAPAPAD